MKKKAKWFQDQSVNPGTVLFMQPQWSNLPWTSWVCNFLTCHLISVTQTLWGHFDDGFICKGMLGENPAPHREEFGATCSSGRNLLPQREQMHGVQWERKWESKARAYMSTAGFLAQGQIRITLPKNSNKQTNKQIASKIRQFLLGTAGISVCTILRLEKMQGQTAGRTSCEGSLVPQNQRVIPSSISTSTTSAHFWAQIEEKLFLEGTYTALGGGDLGVWHSQPIQTPAWQPGTDYTTQLGTAVPPGSHYLTSRGTLYSWWMPFLPVLMETHSLARALGWMPPVPQLWLLLLPALQYFSGYFLGSLTLGMLWLKCRRLILRLFLSQFTPCCHLPLDALQFHQHEWDLKSWSDFSPMRAGKSRHLFRKACWVVSNFIFFL